MEYYRYLLADRVFMVGQTLVPTGLLAAQWVIFNPVGINRVLYVFQLDVTLSAAMEIDVFALGADPALTAGNAPSNADIGQEKALAKFEAQLVARPATVSQIAATQIAPGGPPATILDKPLRVAPGFGVLVSAPAVAGTVCLTAGWVEQGPDSDQPE